MRVYVRVDELIKELGHKADANAERGYMTAFDVIHECIEVVKAQPKVAVVEDVREEAYNKGLEDAWELARKIVVDCKDMTGKEFQDIFGYYLHEVFVNYTPQEALAKLEAYEKAQVEIKVGDVVKRTTTGEEFLIITEENDDSDYEFGVIDLERMSIDRICNDTRYFKKTGKHIDLTDIFKQIGGAE